ncbi:cuticle protein LPCP-23 [Drosophila pseudoobscura]|uniref:Cuticle protein LPCP-23 n=2 Tax=Drosophila pseudoobscura TaxID=7237 RepID=A0A6I8UCK4_DROPS|nr:cuticle protein LPCP-23 [Drosophila pseudoobscura]
MAHQFLSFAASLLLILAPAWAGIIAQPTIGYYGDEHAVAHTQQNVVRSFDGTVSHYAKSVATPYSQVHKQDTRISNNVYQPAIAKTVTYAAPAPAAVYNHHAHPEPQLFTQAAPQAAVYHQAVQAAPVANVYHQEAPQASVYHQAAPQAAVYHQAAPQASVYHQAAPQASVYHQAQPAVIHYSPAESVSHMSFDGFGTHWGF